MVSTRQNRSDLVCAPVGDREPGPAEGWVRCAIEVEAALPVDDWPHLLADAVGRRLAALLPPAAADRLPERGRWRVRAELVDPGVVRLTSDPAHLDAIPDVAGTD